MPSEDTKTPPNGEVNMVEPSYDVKTEPVTGIRLVLMLGSLTLACFLILLDTSIVSTAIPSITDEFHSLHDIGWYGSAYQLGSAVLQPLTGKIYQNFKLKWTFITFFAIFEIGSAVCGAAQSSAMLIGGRVIAGVGASGLINGALTIIVASLPLEKRPLPTAIIMGTSQLGVALGPVVGGAFTSGYTWRWCFYVNLPIGALVAIPLVLVRIPEQIPKKSASSVLREIHHKLDLIGFGIFAPPVIMLLLALQYGGNDFAWDSRQIIGLFCGSGATFILWCGWNYYKGYDALLPFPIIKQRAIWTSGANYTVVMSAMFGVTYFLPVYFQAVRGVKAITSGVYLLAMILPQMLLVMITGATVNRIGYIPPFAIVSGALTAVGTGLFSLFRPDTSTGEWVGFLILTGLGRGIGIMMPIIAIQHAAAEDEISSATAFIVWAQYIGPTVFLSLYNVVFDSVLRSELRTQVPNVNPQAIVDAGATHFRSIVDAKDLQGVLVAYSKSIGHVFYLAAALAAVGSLTGWIMSWKKITKDKQEQASESAELSDATSRTAAVGQTNEKAEENIQ